MLFSVKKDKLEFLKKEKKKISQEDIKKQIEENSLGQLINEYIEDITITKLAQKIKSLGNDQVHCLKKIKLGDDEELKKIKDLFQSMLYFIVHTINAFEDINS